ncbi:DNA-formamidopyrimidine glycosylase family protein [Silvibacterium sp.]|uniref:DNA-formamidopyrimidine glycosylase family protein n=1 Tax=Silvibacterium sp. TaxID=1964179 RepID=UPI0039E4E33F
MPEGDTIFRSARALNKALAGAIVTRFETAYAPLVSVDDDTPVAGRVIERVEARGKWLLIHFSGDLILVTHMLMNGSWHIYRAGERWKRGRQHMRIVITTANYEAVAFDVPVAKFHTARTLERHSAIPKLGPDLLTSGFAADEAGARLLARPDEEVANVLLNQQVMAGIGNVFKSEICFACGVNPFRLVGSLTPSEVDCLLHTAKKMLAANVLDGSGDGIVTYTGARRTTSNADPGARLWVYGRRGRPCRRCGTPILMRRQGMGARSTYWCPECQPAPAGIAITGLDQPTRRRKIGCS